MAIERKQVSPTFDEKREALNIQVLSFSSTFINNTKVDPHITPKNNNNNIFNSYIYIDIYSSFYIYKEILNLTSKKHYNKQHDYNYI